METRMVAQSQVASQSGLEREFPVIDGEVRWYHVSRSRALRRILERSIAAWVQSHPVLDGGNDGGGSRGTGHRPRYRAIFQREGEGHFVHCQIEVVAGGKAWVGSRVGRGIQQALSDCLAHMSLNPQPATA